MRNINSKKNALEKPILAVLFIVIALGASSLAGAWFAGLIGNITTLVEADVNGISASKVNDMIYLSGGIKNIGTVTIESYNLTLYHKGVPMLFPQTDSLQPGQQSSFDITINQTDFNNGTPEIGQLVRVKIVLSTLESGNKQIERIVRVK